MERLAPRFSWLFVGLLIWMAAAVSRSGWATTSPPNPARGPFLSAVDKQHLLTDRFAIVRHVAALPRSVQNALLGANGLSSMADPGHPFNAGDVVFDDTPQRRLVLGAVNASYCLVEFQYGGEASGIAIALYRLHENAASSVWQGYPNSNSLLSFPEAQKRVQAGNVTNADFVVGAPQVSPVEPAATAPSAKALTESDKQHLLQDAFKQTKTVKSIPKSVRDQLLGASAYDGMADAGAAFNGTDALEPRLPMRQLIFAAYDRRYCVAYYIVGGHFGVNPTEVVLFRTMPSRCALVWRASLNSRYCATLAELRRAVSKHEYTDAETMIERFAD